MAHIRSPTYAIEDSVIPTGDKVGVSSNPMARTSPRGGTKLFPYIIRASDFFGLREARFSLGSFLFPSVVLDGRMEMFLVVKSVSPLAGGNNRRDTR